MFGIVLDTVTSNWLLLSDIPSTSTEELPELGYPLRAEASIAFVVAFGPPTGVLRLSGIHVTPDSAAASAAACTLAISMYQRPISSVMAANTRKTGMRIPARIATEPVSSAACGPFLSTARSLIMSPPPEGTHSDPWARTA